MSENMEGAQALPSFAPIARVRALFHYRFGVIAVVALLATFALMLMYNPSGIALWALGALTFLLLAVGGLPERVLGQEAASTKPDKWLPDYNGLNRIGLILAFLLTLVVPLAEQLNQLLPIAPFVNALLHLCGATAGWIILRRIIVFLSDLIERIPRLNAYLTWLTPSRIYQASIISASAFLLYAGPASTIEKFREEFLAICCFLLSRLSL